MITPSVRKPPGGSTMITQGSKPGPNTAYRNVPFPSTSRMAPIATRATVDRSPMPSASSAERPTPFFAEKASCVRG